jgi:hypothetical protein
VKATGFEMSERKRYCTNCGAELSPTVRFCPACGVKQELTTTAPPAQPYAAPPPPPPQQQPYYQPNPQPQQMMDLGKKNGTVFAIASIIIGLVALFIPVLLAALILGFVGIVLGAMGFRRKQKIGGVIGIIIGLIALLASIYIYIVLLTSA